MPMTPQETEDMKAFRQRLHAQIKTEIEPALRGAKEELLSKMKQARDDKAKKQQFLAEYNAAVAALDQASLERFQDELLREQIRRNGGNGSWGDSSADRSQSRIGGFVGDFSGGSSSPEWNIEGLTRRGSPALGHTRSKSSLGNNASLLNSINIRPGSRAMYTGTGLSPSGTRPNHSFEDTAAGLDEARIRKFKEEQARMERAHSPAIPIPVADQAMKKFAEEQARLHRAHSPEIPRSSPHSKFAEEQARLHRAHSPELPRKVSQNKFAEEQARLNGAHSPEIPRNDSQAKLAEEQRRILESLTSRNETRTRAVHTPTVSADAARLAAFQEQQKRAQAELGQQDARNNSGSRMGQNKQTARGKPAPASGRRTPASAQSTFGRIPLNEPDDLFPYDDDSSLTKVEVLFFDLDGTVLDWHGTITEELRRQANKTNVAKIKAIDWEAFAFKWRDLFLATLRGLAAHGDTSARSSVYRSALDELIGKYEKQLGNRWSATVRNGLVETWDRIYPWADVKDLPVIRSIKTLSTLSNLTLREQTQINKHAGLTWDVCLSAGLLGSRIPMSEAYSAAAESMSIPLANCALVSARSDDLRVAGSAGMKTIYVRRSSEDRNVEGEVLSKLEGGEFDLVVGSFQHLALVLGCDID